MVNRELDLSSHTVMDWNNCLREICVEIVEYATANGRKIGGEGRIVEICWRKF